MRLTERVETRGAQAAALTSMLLIAQQVAGKATRDALFLSNFSAKSLPFAMALGALLSLSAVYGLSRWMGRSGPAAVMPVLFALSAGGFVLAWVMARSAPRPAAVLVYLQTALLSPAMISTFWSLINERFDPHAAKRAVARISGGGTLGGVLGGLTVWRASHFVQPRTVLLLLAGLNAFAVVGTLLTRTRRDATATAAPSAEEAPTPWQVLGRAPFLRNLALLVAAGSAISALLDYLFSAQAAASFPKGQPLLAFFSLFWLGVAVLSFLVQLALGKVAIEKLSLAINIAILPSIIVLGGAVGLAVPGLASAALLRGAEAVERNSLFRSAYELLYTPVPEASKRSTKAIIDVGFDRLGTIVGSGVALLVLRVALPTSDFWLLAAVVALALGTLPLARRLHAGYVSALQEGLRSAANRAGAAEPAASERSLTLTQRPAQRAREQLIDGIERIQPGGLSAMLAPEGTVAAAAAPTRAAGAMQSPETMLKRVKDLLSGDERRIKPALQTLDSRGPSIACAILLLSQTAHQQQALAALRAHAPAITGQLIDALLDSTMDFRVRRQLPRALQACPTQRAADGLLLALADERFEVRYAAGRALNAITASNASIVIPEQQVIAIVKRELLRNEHVFARANSLEEERDEIADEESTDPIDALVPALIQDRVDRSLEHVFQILSLLLEREPLRMAFHALHHPDPKYRGTALEYLDVVLPEELHDAIWPYLGAASPLPTARPTHELLADLAEAQ